MRGNTNNLKLQSNGDLSFNKGSKNLNNTIDHYGAENTNEGINKTSESESIQKNMLRQIFENNRNSMRLKKTNFNKTFY